MMEAIDVVPWLDPDTGMAFAVLLMPDDIASHEDAECYSGNDIDAFNAGMWRFIGVVVKAEDGREASVWGVEYGVSPSWVIGTKEIMQREDLVPALVVEILSMPVPEVTE